MALEIDAKNATATATATGDATGKAKAKENKNNNVPAAGEKNLVNGSSAATKKKGALTTTFYPPLCHSYSYLSNKNKRYRLSLGQWLV